MSIYSINLSIYFIVTSLYSINGVAKVLHFNCLYRVKMISGRLLNTTLTENVINCSEYGPKRGFSRPATWGHFEGDRATSTV